MLIAISGVVMRITIVAPIQRSDGFPWIHRMLAMQTARTNLMDAEVLGVKSLDDGCKKRQLILRWGECRAEDGGFICREG